MNHKIELLDGALRFDPFWMAVDALLILHFCVSYYLTFKKEGWKIDYWYLVVGIMFFFPVLVLYPFNASALNRMSMANFVIEADKEIEEAFFITIVGYLSLWVGRYLYSPRYLLTQLLGGTLRPFEQLLEQNIRHKFSVLLITIFSILLIGVIIVIQIKVDKLFNPRDYFHANGTLRPVYNLTLFLFPIALTYVGLNAFQNKGVLYKLLLVGLLGFSAFLGTRSAIMQPIIFLFGFVAFKYAKQIKFRYLLGAAAFFITLTVLILQLREINVNYRVVDKGPVTRTIEEIVYGNTFSDTRDFAIVLSRWEEDYLEGKTYLAGLMAFIPRQLSEYREKWGLGIFTNQTIGFPTKNHPGVRPGQFGEAYFNFSYIGVILLGLLGGFILRHVDVQIKHHVTAEKDIIRAYSKIMIWQFMLCLFISVNFASFYTFILLNMGIALIRQLIAYAVHHNTPKATMPV